MSLGKQFAQQPRGVILAEMIGLDLLVGILDYNTGYEVSMSIFYGVPIFLTAWLSNKKDALLMALIAGITWWWADVQAGHPYLNSWQEGWETFIRLAYFIFIAIGSASLREQRDVATARIALLEHSQKLEHEIIEISEREQRRIGRDLHDGLCQYLAALGCAATSLRDDLTKRDLPAESRVADELARLLRDAVVQTRDLARGLVPVQLNESGLASALEGLAFSVTQLQGINCTFESNAGSIHYEEQAAMHLYRIAQEAINNATKHGDASNIALSLNSAGKVTTLVVADDGKGLSRTRTGGGGMGLNIMNYRARLTGGELMSEEPPAGGTVVRCVLSGHTAKA
jgi:signal transduction histidine kinase